MDILNTLVAMSFGAEQTSVHPVSSGKSETEGMSFARSFDAGVVAVDAEAAMAADKRSAPASDFKKGAPVTIPDDITATADHVNATAYVGKLAMAGLGDGKSGVVTKNVSVGKEAGSTAAGLGDLRAKPTFGKVLAEAGGAVISDSGKSVIVANPGAEGAEVKAVADTVDPVQSVISDGKGVAAGDVPAAPNDVATEIVNTPSMQQSGLAQPPRPKVLGRGEDHEAKQEMARAGVVKAELASAAKRTYRDNESTAAAKTSHQAKEAAGNVTVVVTKPATGTDTQTNVVSLSAGVVVPIVAAQNGAGSASKSSFSTVVPAVVERRGGAVAATNGRDGKESVSPGKVTAVDDKPEVTTAEGSGASSISGSEFAKAAAIATSPIGDGEGKLQSSHVGLTHAAGDNGVVSGLVAGVASAHVVGDMTAAKLQSGETGSHTATLHATWGETDGSEVMSASLTEGAHRTLMATPTSLEVGVANGTHGWLKIRAEMASGGIVSASLSTASPAGQEMLHRELPSLAAYLQQEQVAVNVVVHAPVVGTESHGLAGGLGSDVSGQAQERHGQGGEGRSGAVTAGLNLTDEGTYEGLNVVGVDGVLPVTYAGGGSWLSVRA